MQRRQVAVSYFAFQALAVAGWWLVLAVDPSYRALFALRQESTALLAFAPGDIAIVVLGSAYVAIRRGRGPSSVVAWIVAGAMLYGALYTVTIRIARIGSPLAVVLMVPASLATCWAANVLSRGASSPISSGTSS